MSRTRHNRINLFPLRKCLWRNNRNQPSIGFLLFNRIANIFEPKVVMTTGRKKQHEDAHEHACPLHRPSSEANHVIHIRLLWLKIVLIA